MKIGLIIASLALSVIAIPAQADQWPKNPVIVDCPWAEATQSGVAPVYMEIRADSRGGHRLISAFSERAESAEINSFTRVAGVLTRQRIEYLPIEANQAVQLVPGGYHVLLVGLKAPLVAGTRFEAWVEFAPLGGFVIEVQVVRPGAGAPCGRGVDTCPLPAGAPPLRVLPAPPPVWIPGRIIPRGSF